jgi:hypothetical protein
VPHLNIKLEEPDNIVREGEGEDDDDEEPSMTHGCWLENIRSGLCAKANKFKPF